MKYYIIAGEASGDLHGSNLIKALRKKDPECKVRAWGGDMMENAGATLVKHYKETAFMGFIEVLQHLPEIFRNLRYCKEDIQEFKPDALIFIDYSGFNLRIAKWAKPKGFNTHYYIAPQIWASREGRVRKMKAYINHIYVILPFEKEFYQGHGINVHFVGHPLLDAISEKDFEDKAIFYENSGLDPDKKLIALLPGSRKQEVGKILPIMLSVIDDYPEFQFAIAGALSLDRDFYDNSIKGHEIPVIVNKTYTLLHHAHAALVTSGTATLETALLNVPQVVCYKGSRLSYWIAKRLINLKYISLVNLIMDKEVVRELIQDELTSKNLKNSLSEIITGESRERILQDYKILESALGGQGASDSAAGLIIENS